MTGIAQLWSALCTGLSSCGNGSWLHWFSAFPGPCQCHWFESQCCLHRMHPAVFHWSSTGCFLSRSSRREGGRWRRCYHLTLIASGSLAATEPLRILDKICSTGYANTEISDIPSSCVWTREEMVDRRKKSIFCSMKLFSYVAMSAIEAPLTIMMTATLCS